MSLEAKPPKFAVDLIIVKDNEAPNLAFKGVVNAKFGIATITV
jgi:hypothetical protein